jgi:hypothetical protein
LHSVYPAHFIFTDLIALVAVNESNKLRNPLSCNFYVFLILHLKYQNCKHYIKGNVMLGVTMFLSPCYTKLSGGHRKSPGRNPPQI